MTLHLSLQVCPDLAHTHHPGLQNSASRGALRSQAMESSSEIAMARKLHFACALSDYELEQPTGRDHAHCSNENDITAT
jgi:hypothetical protein